MLVGSPWLGSTYPKHLKVNMVKSTVTTASTKTACSTRVDFIAVNYNGSRSSLRFIETALVALSAADAVNGSVVIVDNNSNLAEQQLLRDGTPKDERVHLLFENSNSGYFGGLNVGLSWLGKRNSSLDYVVAGNNDLEFHEQFVQRLVNAEFPCDVWVIVPDLITPSGMHQNPASVGRLSRLHLAKIDLYFTSYQFAKLLAKAREILPSRGRHRHEPKAGYIEHAVGACYILARSFLSTYRRLDDRVFLWGEETLIANQVRALGGRTWLAPELQVNHVGEASVGKMPKKKYYEIAKESYRIARPYS